MSGYVYVDANSNQTKDSGDWAIADATITLTKASSSTPFATVLSNHDGSYSFDGLASGAVQRCDDDGDQPSGTR